MSSVQQQREQRIMELKRRADSLRDKASAFTAAATYLLDGEPQHRRYYGDWQQIAERLIEDARRMENVALRCDDDVARLAAHVTAASAYVPPKATEISVIRRPFEWPTGTETSHVD